MLNWYFVFEELYNIHFISKQCSFTNAQYFYFRPKNSDHPVSNYKVSMRIANIFNSDFGL